jgi:hypothetical protein
MYSLLFIFISIPVGKIGWIDISTLLSIVGLIIYVYRLGRSRVTQDDLKEALKPKADRTMVESALELRDQKIEMIDKNIKEQLTKLFEELKEQRKDIKELLKRKS